MVIVIHSYEVIIINEHCNQNIWYSCLRSLFSVSSICLIPQIQEKKGTILKHNSYYESPLRDTRHLKANL